MVDLGGNTRLDDFQVEQAFDLNVEAAVVSSRSKRVLDFVLAIGLLVFVMPLLVVVAIGIILDSAGPIFFLQRRTGLDGLPIRVFKFRTMTVLETGSPVRQVGRNDQRVTRIGRFLRRSSIDELPQLVNVIRGEMSLVGPRPHAVAHDQYYGALVPRYMLRFRARPGITGLAQVKGLRGEIHSIRGMADRVAEDNAYIEAWSLWLDLKILAKTAFVAAFQASAY